MTGVVRVAVLSDTHGLLRPGVDARVRDADVLVHAGDIDRPETLARLHELAPRHTIVRGNMDRGAWTASLRELDFVEAGGLLIAVTHDLEALDPRELPAETAVIVCGHSHKPATQHRDGRLILNPGGAGPRRFHLPPSMAILTVRNGVPAVDFVDLDPR